ncbi:amino acid ABC transporter permease [Desulfoluna spongiiphila]|uniref:Amino acid ABC transporter membrane protein 1, PAAT family n=1 Tax=Desulfoluna spongiiphila TaxID=419481 RepID=A0A1G5H0X1_9BACT|nr:ABC transporter permease subunit [Desulfoluna spongiiphila]SCY57493.1 amino acid ABC transporter membrane protein 1, PAAT family [Desulfoluna spongiiphila]VVS94712.1 amino acid abc transporter permease protein 3-tm domain [Desulfoluna spongiiphila]
MKQPQLSFTKAQGRTLLVQLLVMGGILWFCHLLFVNTQANLASRNIASGFGFLAYEAGMPISDALMPYTPADTYGYAFFIGVLNTLYVSAVSIVLATLIGVVVGVARVSSNWLVARLAEIYVEVLRNIPLLLILFFTYGVVLAALPSPRRSLHWGVGLFLNNRGIYFPKILPESGFWFIPAALVLGLVISVIVHRKGTKRRKETGRALPSIRIGLVLTLGLPLLAALLLGLPASLELPVLKGFNFKGGSVIRPEFCALLIGLVLYTAAFIAENVRSGIQSVAKGQLDAAHALGLPEGLIMRRVILPQALRVTIPSTTNDYASLVKNSSLAVAIGYPDMVSVGGTIIGQNDQAIEIIVMWMSVYLCINLLISLFMNWLNARVQLIGR